VFEFAETKQGHLFTLTLSLVILLVLGGVALNICVTVVIVKRNLAKGNVYIVFNRISVA